MEKQENVVEQKYPFWPQCVEDGHPESCRLEPIFDDFIAS